jgi:hypothetical protein
MRYPLGASPYPHVIVGARECTDNTSFAIAAAGSYDTIFRRTDSPTAAHGAHVAQPGTNRRRATSDHGAYWYFVPGQAMGFAGVSEIQLGTPSTSTLNDETVRSHLRVSSGGFEYATLDLVDPSSTSIGCQYPARLPLPAGYAPP